MNISGSGKPTHTSPFMVVFQGNPQKGYFLSRGPRLRTLPQVLFQSSDWVLQLHQKGHLHIETGSILSNVVDELKDDCAKNNGMEINSEGFDLSGCMSGSGWGSCVCVRMSVLMFFLQKRLVRAALRSWSSTSVRHEPISASVWVIPSKNWTKHKSNDLWTLKS